MNLRLGSLLAAIAVSAGAHADLIDFESLRNDRAGLTNVGDVYSEDGFTLTETGDNFFYSINSGDFRYTGSVSLFSNSSSGLITLTRNGGGAFSLDSIDLDGLNSGIPARVTFVASLAGGGTQSESFVTDSAFPALQTFFFSSAFDNVASVSWRQASPYHKFDNVAVTPVPEPAAFAALGLGLVALVSRRKRK